MTSTSFVLAILFGGSCFGIIKSYEFINLLRRKRHLVFPDPLGSETKVQVLFGLGLPMEGEISMTLGYVLKCNYDLPYNASDLTQDYIRYQRSADEVSLQNGKEMTSTGSTTRWDIYRILETAMEALGSGKACLLRAVCEAAETSFREDHGLLGELLHVLLTPSTTFEEYNLYSDREYHVAEVLGKKSDGKCRHFYPECSYSPLDYFTDIYDKEV